MNIVEIYNRPFPLRLGSVVRVYDINTKDAKNYLKYIGRETTIYKISKCDYNGDIGAPYECLNCRTNRYSIQLNNENNYHTLCACYLKLKTYNGIDINVKGSELERVVFGTYAE